MPKSILAIGELLADLITEDYVSDLSETRALRLFQGGSPANLCANLRYLGADASLIATVGTDGIGDLLLHQLAKIGLSASQIERTPYFPTSLVLVGKSQSTPDFIAYRLADTQIKWVDPHIILKAGILHTTAFALSKNPARSTIMSSLKLGFESGREISVDWNFSERIWMPDSGKDEFAQICAMKPLLKCSLDDVTRFLGKETDAQSAMDFLENQQTTVTCLTCGKDGVWYSTIEDASWVFCPAAKVNTVVDTTGAGDAFWAGFLSAWAGGTKAHDCVQKGLAVAAQKVQQQGPLYEN